MDRKNFTHSLFLVFGTLLGLLLAESVGRVVLLRAGQTTLNEYAGRLEQTAIRVDQEGEAAINTVLSDGLPFCSPEEIYLMRGLVYKSSEIKDIGRVRDQKLFCSSEIGTIPDPWPTPKPDAEFRHMKIYVWAPIAFGKQARGFIIQVKAVNIVLNPNAFEAWKDGHFNYASYLFDSQSQSLIQGFGAKMPLSKEEIVAGRTIERDHIYYRPLCSAQARICVVAAESRKDMMAENQPLHAMLLIAGALLGDTLVLTLLLFYRRHRSTERQLRRALRKDRVTVVYQPIVNVDTGVIVGAEALARWVDEQNNSISPDIFVALAEENGFVSQITRSVLTASLTHLHAPLAAGGFRLTINISPQDLEDRNFASLLKDSLQYAGLPASALGLELTERSTANHQVVIDSIAKLRATGYTIYLDDFGTGYSSLAYLRDLAVDYIKIDRAFTATVGTNAITESLIPQILNLASQLHLAVVVEGIETAEQAAYFRSSGSHVLGQGWFYSKPVSAQELLELVEDNPAAP